MAAGLPGDSSTSSAGVARLKTNGGVAMTSQFFHFRCLLLVLTVSLFFAFVPAVNAELYRIPLDIREEPPQAIQKTQELAGNAYETDSSDGQTSGHRELMKELGSGEPYERPMAAGLDGTLPDPESPPITPQKEVSGCAVALQKSEIAVGAAGGSGTVHLTGGEACQQEWLAQGIPWLKLQWHNGLPNEGGTITYTVTPNRSSTERIAAITVATKVLTITQIGAGQNHATSF
jgi:hypothetical protein